MCRIWHEERFYITARALFGGDMKKYYLIGAIAAVVLFALTCVFFWCMYGVTSNNVENLISNLEENSVVLRYYTDEDFDAAGVVYIRVLDKENYRLETIPSKEGFVFVGLFDTATDQQYVTSDGNGIVTLTDNVLLYAKFEEA